MCLNRLKLTSMKHGSFVNMHVLAYSRREAPIRLSQSYETWKFYKHAFFGIEEKLQSEYLSPMKHGSFKNMHFLASKRSSDRINSVLWNMEVFSNMHVLASKRSSDQITSVVWSMEVLQTCMFWHRREAPNQIVSVHETWKFCRHACFGIEEKLR